MEIEGVLFVLGLGANLLPVSTLENVGYVTLFKQGHVFVYSEPEGPNNTVLLGEMRGRVYMLRGQYMLGKSRWLSDFRSVSKGEEIEVVPSNQFGI